MVLLLAGFSSILGRDPLAAAAPLQFAIYGALALLAVEIAKSASGYVVRAAAPLITRTRWVTEADVRLGVALIAYVAIALVLGTLAVQAGARSQNVSGRWQGFEAIGGKRFRDVTIQLRDATALDRALAEYYFPDARLRFMDFRAGAQPPFEAISESTPMFIQHLNCSDVGHEHVFPVPRFGCLLLAPPGAQLETSYPFNRRFLFLDHSGMTRREPGGRWNVGPDMEWRLAADPTRGALDRELYLNVSLNPYLPAKVPPHRVRFVFKNGDTAEIAVEKETQLSVPVRQADWTTNRLSTLAVRVDFPDGRTMLFHELSLTAKPHGVVVARKSEPRQG